MRVARADRVLICITVLLTSFSCAAAPYASEADDYVSLLQHLDAERAWSIVDQLAGDTYSGRRSGTRGADLASEYIADYFGSIGLKPAGSDEGYRSEFTVPLWELAQFPSVTLVDERDNVLQTLDYRKDFNVMPGSGGGDYSADVVFAGYGITANDLDYDDYAGVSAQGKIVLAIIGAPPSEKLTEGDYGAPCVKAGNALSHGAVGLILVDIPAAPTPEYIQRSRCGCCWTIYQGLTVLGGSIQLADTLLKGAGTTLSSIQAAIDQKLTPKSFALGKRLHVSVSAAFIKDATTYDVLGFISGSDPDASKKVVIVGAHYDHWGRDVNGDIFRGANDDASGTAVVMEIASVLSTWAKPRWSILFATWSGEEEGFYGSRAYTSRPNFPLADTIAYLNLDMVGYGKPLLGEVSEFNTALRSVIVESAEQLNVTLQVEAYEGGSDTASFEESRVPNAMFIYWPDQAYHTPADTASHVSRGNLLETARLTALTTLKLSEAVAVLTTVTATAPEQTQLTSDVSTMNVLLVFGVTLAITVVAGALYLRSKRHQL